MGGSILEVGSGGSGLRGAEGAFEEGEVPVLHSQPQWTQQGWAIEGQTEELTTEELTAAAGQSE